MAADYDGLYEASDEASENEMLESSLSKWKGFCVSNENDFNPIPLDIHTAASVGQYDCIQMAVKSGKDVDAPNYGGWTPLMYASYIGHDDIVNLLIDAGVNVNKVNDKGQSPLMLAASCGNESAAFFLLQAKAVMEACDNRGWTALFHATYAAHQNMVKYLLENGSNVNTVEYQHHFTPLMEAAASGHEIIVQCLLQHKADVNAFSQTGETARSLALINGHPKIVNIIDNHVCGPSRKLRREAGLQLDDDLSSSDELTFPPVASSKQPKNKGPSIHEGPEACARLFNDVQRDNVVPVVRAAPASNVPSGYLTFDSNGPLPSSPVRCRDLTSPMKPGDWDSSGSRDSSTDYDDEADAFTKPDAVTVRSGSSSGSHLINALRLSRNNSTDGDDKLVLGSNTVPTPQPASVVGSSPKKASVITNHSVPQNGSNAANNRISLTSSSVCNVTSTKDNVPYDLASLLEDLGLSKYLSLLEEQDVDLQVFLTLTDNDLKEIGIKLFGPRRKMTNAIARWHSNARPAKHDLEQAYADHLEAEMQELAIQLHQAMKKSEQLGQQLEQEQQLRSVAESCLMENRMTWQNVHRLATETRAQCTALHSIAERVRYPCADLLRWHDNLRLPNQQERDKCREYISQISSALSQINELTECIGASMDELLGNGSAHN